MYRFLIATMPLTGHITPVLPVARRLVERGHAVRWYTGRKFQAKVEATGARFAPMKAAYDFDDSDFSKAFPGREKLNDFKQLKFDLKHVFMDATPGQYQDLQEILKEFPADALLCDPGFGGGALLDEKGGPPWAALGITALTIASRDTAPFGLALPPSASVPGRLRNRLLYGLLNKVLFRDVNAHLQKVRAQLGLPPTKIPALDASLSPYLYLEGTTQAFEYPRSDLPPQVHFIGPLLAGPPSGFNPPAWWDELLTTDRPVVHVTQGTWATAAERLLVPTLEALADENVLVVATTGGKPVESLELAKIPANARIETFIPHYHLLPHVNVMVTNAGYGGVQQALACGVPLVAAGTTEDKPEICSRVAWSGAGVRLKAKELTKEHIRRAVKEILGNPAYKERALDLKDDFARHNAPDEAAQLLEQLAATRQPVLRDRFKATPFQPVPNLEDKVRENAG